jgi:hypothetical protein
MARDPRLASVELLTLAALRARERQEAPRLRPVTLQVVYYDALSGEETPGPSYTYDLPAE